MSDASSILKDWHFKKEFHAGHVLTTLVLVGSVIMAWINLERQQAAMETQLAMQERRIALLEEIQRNDITDERLARIEVAIERQTITIERLLDQAEGR